MKKNNFKMSRLGDILLHEGVVSEKQLMEALSYQKLKGVRIGKALIELGYVSETELLRTFSKGLKIPIKKVSDVEIDEELLREIPENVIKEHSVFPFEKDEHFVKVLVTDPFNIVMEDEIRNLTGLEVEIYLTYERDLENLIDKYFDQEKVMNDLKDLGDELDEEMNFNLDVDDENAVIVKITNKIFRDAVEEDSSDIHIEVNENNVTVRYRVDGILQKVKELPKSSHAALTSRIKTMAGMDITVKRMPQDGRIQITIGNKPIDMRVSTLPTINGEKTTIRLLDKTKMLLSLSSLGFTETNMEKFQKAIKNPFGLVLITGPTGSGKSSTLYTVINELNDVKTNIMTIEDPVEYKLDGINQVQVNQRANMTFAAGLRSILRQDPDTILIGEIRDKETAQIAVKASNTGHMVFATLHTNDAVSSVMRLIDMDVEPYLVASTVTAVVNQRLVRRICKECKTSYTSIGDTKDRLFFGVPSDTELTLYHGTGKSSDGKECEHCKGTGYKGRLAVHELLMMTDDVRRLIIDGAKPQEIKEKALQGGFISMKEDGYEKALLGLTTLDEVRRFVVE